MDKFQEIFEAIKADPQNVDYTARGIDPLYSVYHEARICIVGQAPGIRAEESKLYWNDPSGDRLRDWMGIRREDFYSSKLLSIVPMDFYFPGKGKSGDLPPRKGFAEKWHPKLIAEMPDLELFILIGSYAQKHYLKLKSSDKSTDVIRNYKNYLPKYFPLVHPSPRNNIWMTKNDWFERDVLPDFQIRIKKILI